jgi:hypothetical protein
MWTALLAAELTAAVANGVDAAEALRYLGAAASRP